MHYLRAPPPSFIYKRVIHKHSFHPTYTTLILAHATQLWSNAQLQLYCTLLKADLRQSTDTLCCEENPCICADSLDDA